MKKILLFLILLTIFFSCKNVASDPDTGGASGPESIDLVLLIDGTGSMQSRETVIKNSIKSFCQELKTEDHHVRLAVIMFGSAPEIIVDWTEDPAEVSEICSQISIPGPEAGVHLLHNSADDTCLETIRICLNQAENNTLNRTNVGGDGPLVFRDGARKKIILYADEPSEATYFSENSLPQYSSYDSAVELSETADILIDQKVELISFISPRTNVQTLMYQQFSSPSYQIQDADYSHFDQQSTLQDLQVNGLEDSLQARLLEAGIFSRCILLTDAADSDVITHVYMDAVSESF